VSFTHEELTEARIFAISAPLILPMLEKRKSVAMSKLLMRFREGGTDFTTLVAELNTLCDLERELKTKEQLYNTLQEKQK